MNPLFRWLSLGPYAEEKLPALDPGMARVKRHNGDKTPLEFVVKSLGSVF
jgi:hypothetical protein